MTFCINFVFYITMYYNNPVSLNKPKTDSPVHEIFLYCINILCLLIILSLRCFFFYHVWYKYVNHMLKYTQRNRLCRYFVMDLNGEKVLKCVEKTLNQWFYTWKYAWNASCISDRGWAVSLKECEISRQDLKKKNNSFSYNLSTMVHCNI